MKTLIFGAGPLGIFYAHLLHEAGVDVTILARGARLELIEKRKLELVNGFSGERATPGFKVIDHLSAADNYDLVVVLVRKNKIPSVLETLAECPKIAHILFMGNNVQGFDAYREKLPAQNLLFGFPGAGGGWNGDAVEYVDREDPKDDRMPIRIGEMDGVHRQRTAKIQTLFQSAGIPVEVVDDIDGWLKYHAAFVVPIGMGIYRNDCDLRALAADSETLRLMVGACKECGNVLKESGYTKRQPFKFNLFYWMPELVTAKIFRSIFESRYAEVAFAKHAEAARDEFELLADEFQSLIDQTTIKTPLFETLRHKKRHP